MYPRWRIRTRRTGASGITPRSCTRDVRVPAGNLIGNEGSGFVLAQHRLGPGRIHHCMRWLGQSQRAFDMLCERAVSRYAHGSMLAEKQTIQNWVADSMAEMAGSPPHDPAGRLEDGSGGGGGGPGGDRHDQVLRGQGAVRRDRPRHPGARVTWASRPTCRSSRCTAMPGRPGSTTGPTRCTARRWPGACSKGYAPHEVPTEHIPTRRAEAQRRFADLLADLTVDA